LTLPPFHFAILPHQYSHLVSRVTACCWSTRKWYEERRVIQHQWMRKGNASTTKVNRIFPRIPSLAHTRRSDQHPLLRETRPDVSDQIPSGYFPRNGIFQGKCWHDRGLLRNPGVLVVSTGPRVLTPQEYSSDTWMTRGVSEPCALSMSVSASGITSCPGLEGSK
jgi:hypothetical protein